MKCPNCNSENPEGAVFCNNCGNRLIGEKTIRCKKCNSVNPFGSTFCNKCGNPLLDGSQVNNNHNKGKSKNPVTLFITLLFLIGLGLSLYSWIAVSSPQVAWVDENIYDDHTEYTAAVADYISFIATTVHGKDSEYRAIVDAKHYIMKNGGLL